MANTNENKEAYQMMKNTLGSIENRFREAYNKGYKDGLRDGASQVTTRLVSKILEETKADTPQNESQRNSEKVKGTPQTECRTCKWALVSWTSHHCDDCEAHSKYEPQTERSE